MAALEAAQQQLETAVKRLEAAARGLLDRAQASQPARGDAALQDECRRLRQELEAAAATNSRLAQAVEEAEHRLQDAISRLDAVSGG